MFFPAYLTFNHKVIPNSHDMIHYSLEFEQNIEKNCSFLLLSERRNYASKELLKFYLMASLKSSNMRMNPVAATLNKPLFYAIRPLRNILSKF